MYYLFQRIKCALNGGHTYMVNFHDDGEEGWRRVRCPKCGAYMPVLLMRPGYRGCPVILPDKAPEVDGAGSKAFK